MTAGNFSIKHACISRSIEGAISFYFDQPRLAVALLFTYSKFARSVPRALNNKEDLK
jgi:hypothetical protein